MNKNHLQSLVFNGFRAISVFLIIANLSACVSTNKPISRTEKTPLTPDLVCQSIARYENQVIGDGQCVSLIKRCSGAPHTSTWRPGSPVLNSELPPGTVIATFKNSRYPNQTGHHAAVYIKQDQQGIWVWDQWLGKPVHKRLIRIRDDGANPGNTAQAYKVVRLE